MTIGDPFSRLGADRLTFRPPREGSERAARAPSDPSKAPRCVGAVFCYALGSQLTGAGIMWLQTVKPGVQTRRTKSPPENR